MSNGFSKKIEDVMYVVLLDSARESLKKGQLAKEYNAKSSEDKKKIKQEIMVQLKKTSREVATTLSKEDVLEPTKVAENESKAVSIIKEVLRRR